MKKVYLPASVILIVFVLASAAFAINDSTSVASVNNVDPSGSFASSGVYGWCRDCSGFCSSVLINLPDCSVAPPAICKSSGGESVCDCPTGFNKILGGNYYLCGDAHCSTGATVTFYTCYKK